MCDGHIITRTDLQVGGLKMILVPIVLSCKLSHNTAGNLVITLCWSALAPTEEAFLIDRHQQRLSVLSLVSQIP